LAAVPLVGCGNHAARAAPGASGPIEECDAFVASYERCLDAVGPSNVAEARAAQTRAALAAEATHGASARAVLREKCADNRSQLPAACR
jgi:hypothetical protein